MENSIIKGKMINLIETINNFESRLDRESEEIDTIDLMFSYEELKEQTAEILRMLK